MPAADLDRLPGQLPQRVVVVGAGTMGARIALCLARAGVIVTVTSRSQATLRAAEQVIGSANLVDLTTDAGPALATADLVIESIREDLADKHRVLCSVEDAVRPGTLLTTNTSSLDLALLAGPLERPEDFAGLHWFHPADLMPLVEVVPAPVTGGATTAALASWMTALGKTAVVLRRPIPGFVGNRLQYALLREAYALVAAGVCSRADVDRAVTHGLGPRWAAVGPFASMDLAGLDVHLEVTRSLFPDLSNAAAAPAELIELVAEGRLGVKSGSGLLGAYSADERGRLEERRDQMLRLVAGGRDGEAG